MGSQGIKEAIISYLNFTATYINVLMSGPEVKYFLLALSFLILLMVILYLRQSRKMDYHNKESLIVKGILNNLNPGKGVEKTLYDLLEIIRSIVEARGYFFYIYDVKNDQFVLKAVKHMDTEDGVVRPSYSGLTSHKKESYIPALTLPTHEQPALPALLKEGQVPVMVIPIQGGKGLIRLGPVKKVSGKTMARMVELGALFQPVLEALLEIEQLRNEVEVQATSSKAMQNITNATMDFEGTLKMTMGLSVKMIASSGGALLVKGQQGYGIPFVTGFPLDVENSFIRDESAHENLDNLLGREDVRIISRNEEEYYRLPSHFAAGGAELLILVSIDASRCKGIALYWYYDLPILETHRLTALKVMTKRMGDLLDSHQRYQEISGSYLDMLKMLVQTLDNLEPHTVGYSELMARFAGIIAREMHLDSEEIKEVALAAYLSNIGILGFSNELLFKEGQYTQVEYETMKLHSEVGASIIEATIGNRHIASYIKYHHERMDGNGYPIGLKGEDIPLGARIIAVVQTFLAKLRGRKYRKPLPFEQALQLLRSASGTQLDMEVVQALSNWFKKKQNNTARSGRSLGACWEMMCVPVNICLGCPAYENAERNCWECERVNCEAHGNECDSCFVYTEYLSRMKRKSHHVEGELA